MLKCDLHYLKTKHAVKKLPFVIRYLPDRFKTQEMCDEAILENGVTLKSVLYCYKNQKMCNKTVDNYAHASGHVPDCYKIQQICNKAVYTCPFNFNSVTDRCKIQKMCDKTVSKDLFYAKILS